MEKYPWPYNLPLRFTDDERLALLKLAEAALVNGDQTCTMRMAFGKLLAGEDMTTEERHKLLPREWYLSPTGRKLKHRLPTETPITPKLYASATALAILSRSDALCKPKAA